MTSSVDMHMHSTASDGSDTPEELLEKIRENSIGIFALTDHDTLKGASQLLTQGPFDDLCFIPGVELSSKTKSGRCHLLGYSYDPDSPSIKEAVVEVALRRMEKIEIRIDNLRKIDGIKLTNEEKDWIFSNTSPGRPHLAQILMKRGLVSSVQEAFKIYLNSAHSPVPRDISRIEAELALSGIHNAGGVSCWAHPLGGESDVRLREWEFEEMLRELMALGLQALECYYSRYSKEDIEFLLSQAKKHGLMVSGGSDYHGTNKNIALGTLCSQDMRVTREDLSILDRLL